MYRTTEPDGCFVLVEREQVIGYTITHRWGTVGWFGPLGVAPAYQGQGYGKDLVLLSLESLVQRGAQVIGLETMPDSLTNLGFYSRLGFEARGMSFVLSKNVGNLNPVSSNPLYDLSLDTAPQLERSIEQCRCLTERTYPGLEYTPEIRQTRKYRFGTTLCCLDGGITAFAVCHSRKYFRAEKSETLRVKIAVADSFAGRPAVESLIRGVEQYARRQGKVRVHFNINARHWSWYLMLLDQGYHIVASGLRMLYHGYDKEIEGHFPDFNRWVA
jgi:hypothetical protein